MHTVELLLGDEKIIIQTGKVAKQADGAVWVQQGGTVVLAAAVASDQPTQQDFFPLTVDYRERMYAIGKIPQIYGRREPRPGAPETLIARLVDHCIRPLFPKEFKHETQVQIFTLSSDQVHPTETLALIGASAALSISDIPFHGPVGGLLVARVNGEFIPTPTYQQLEEADIYFFVTGTKTAVMSVEGGAKEAPEEDVVAAIEFAHREIQRIVTVQEQLVEVAGKPKREVVLPSAPERLAARIRELATERIRDSIQIHDKQARQQYLEEVRAQVVASLEDDFLDEVERYEDAAADIFMQIEKEEMRHSILHEGKRVDGRAPDELRPIECEVGVLPRTHGSALFTRGETQALATVTLGTALDENIIRNIRGEYTERFFLHYNFPAFSVGEVRRITAPSRREIGHGYLAQHALEPVIPSRDEFPYAIRVVSEILESNSSSSMATVCAASLALMDAGVPIRKAVAGVGVGLIKEGDKDILLTDMVGAEDHLGDMDFKVAGTADGVTAIQLDIKIEGVSVELLRRALEQARRARLQVLDIMNAVIDRPRDQISPYAPRITTIYIDKDRIGELIGPGGKVVRAIQDEFDVTISIQDDGAVQIAATNEEAAQRVIAIIQDMFAEIEPGQRYTGAVTRIVPFGAFVEIKKGVEGLIHISDLANGYIRRVEDVVNVGDKVDVEVINVDSLGRIDLKPVEKFTAPESSRRDEPGPEGGPRSSGGGRRGGDRRRRDRRSGPRGPRRR